MKGKQLVPVCESCHRRKNVQPVIWKKKELPNEWWCTRCKEGWWEAA